MASGPEMKFDGRRGNGSPARCRSGRRRSSSENITFSSMPRKRRAHAEVRAEAEREVRVRVAPHVEALGFLEHARVAVGRRVHEDELVARVQRLRRAARRRAVTVRDMFLIGDTHRSSSSTPVSIVAGSSREDRELVGMVEQRQHAVGHHVPARLVAADEDQQALLDDRLVVEALAVDLGVAEDADEVVLRRLRPAVGDDAELELAEREHRLHPGFASTAGGGSAVVARIRSSDQRNRSS